MNNFKSLKVWELGREIATSCYDLMGCLDQKQQFIFHSQVMRSVTSIPSNVAEGNSSRSKKGFTRFIEIALGFAFELETQLLILQDLGEGDLMQISRILELLEEEQRTPNGLIKMLLSQDQ